MCSTSRSGSRRSGVCSTRPPRSSCGPASGTIVRILAVCFLSALAHTLPGVVAAQTTFLVEGRVFDTETNAPVLNAVVTLTGQRPILTGVDGDFSFTDVEPGTYTLQVEAFGYVASSSSLPVQQDLTLAMRLDPAPFMLDSLVVAPLETEVEGRVRDLEKDADVQGAEVFTSLGETVRTGRTGRFRVNAWEEVPLLLQIRAFGYLPVDTIVTAAPDEAFVFDLDADSLVQKMIDVEIGRIAERAGGRRAITVRSLNREALLRRRGLTIFDVLENEYRGRVSLGCVVLDERVLTPAMADGMIRTILVQEVELVEFLFGGRMMRIYTRDFMRRMLGSGIELRDATYVDMARPPLCT